MSTSTKAECSVIALPPSATSPKGTMRCVSVQEIDVPPEIVWTLLLDFNRYPKFVGGITACQPYSRRRTLTGGKVDCAKYTAAVGPFKLRYYIEHHFEPLQHSMTWHLDYGRRSDIYDSVGYWCAPRADPVDRIPSERADPVYSLRIFFSLPCSSLLISSSLPWPPFCRLPGMSSRSRAARASTTRR